MSRIRSIKDVVEWGLCVGCGACRYFCGDDSIEMKNIETVGIIPVFKKSQDDNYSECLKFCPGYTVGSMGYSRKNKHEDFSSLIGPAVEIWEGFASDQDIRYRASSGGALSALAAYCLEKENMAFVLHTGMDENKPWCNKTVQSTNRNDVLERSGSRYAPSSPCDSLSLIESSPRPCVFIGKPCDVAAATALRKSKPALDKNLGLVLSFFCAGPPCTAGTLSLMEYIGAKKEDVKSVRYRGNGWPGYFEVSFLHESETKILSYEESWGTLADHHRSFRCHLCPDGMGELADISCGDAWHLYDKINNDPGRSLVLSRTRRGNEILHRAMESGYLKMEKSNAEDVVRAQNMAGRRAFVFGRLAAMKTLLVPVPRFAGFPLYQVWRTNSSRIKIKTYLGTLRRLLTRGLWHPNPLNRTRQIRTNA